MIIIGAIHGAIDCVKGVGSFLKRPLILFALWIMTCVSVIAISWLFGHGSVEMVTVGQILIYPITIFGIIGPVGCSIFLPWVHSSEIF
jgi:hypothetical protein